MIPGEQQRRRRRARCGPLPTPLEIARPNLDHGCTPRHTQILNCRPCSRFPERRIRLKSRCFNEQRDRASRPLGFSSNAGPCTQRFDGIACALLSLLRRTRRQVAATLRSTCIDDLASIGTGHPLAKPVGSTAGSTTGRRKSFLHGLALFVSVRWKRQDPRPVVASYRRLPGRILS